MSNLEALLWLMLSVFILWNSYKVAACEGKIAKLEEARIRFDLAAGRLERSIERFDEARDRLYVMVRKVEERIQCP